ncbi:hypothetical protein AAY473_027952, partial [Plecturocebus cupreus]
MVMESHSVDRLECSDKISAHCNLRFLGSLKVSHKSALIQGAEKQILPPDRKRAKSPYTVGKGKINDCKNEQKIMVPLTEIERTGDEDDDLHFKYGELKEMREPESTKGAIISSFKGWDRQRQEQAQELQGFPLSLRGFNHGFALIFSSSRLQPRKEEEQI